MIEPVLYVGRSSSRCGNCGRGARAVGPSHDVIVECGPDTGKPGCGAVYTAIVDVYINTAMESRRQ